MLIVLGTYVSGWGQAPDSTQTRRFVIDVGGIKVGTMTALRQPKGNQTVLYTIISDVSVNLLVYKVKVYYKMVSLMQQGKLIRSTVEAQTNKGSFVTKTEWKQDHYDIVAEQYKYSRKATETRPYHLYTEQRVLWRTRWPKPHLFGVLRRLLRLYGTHERGLHRPTQRPGR